MAGGKGTRLRPYTNILPKPLLPLGLRSIIEINIRQLADFGIDNIIIAVGYMGELIETIIGNGEKFGITIKYSYEEHPLGTVGALSLIVDDLEDNFIVMNGDILHNINFENLFSEHYKSKCVATITLYKQIHRVNLGVIEISNNRIINYLEKPKKEYSVSMGFYIIQKSIILKHVIYNEYLDFPDFINDLIGNNKGVCPYYHNGLWIDLGTTEEYISIIDRLDDIKDKYSEIPILL